MVESTFNIALGTMGRIDRAIDMCNDAIYKTPRDFKLWYRGLELLYTNISTWMTPDENAYYLVKLRDLQHYRRRHPGRNMDDFQLILIELQKMADKHKLLIKTAEDTMYHGGQ